MYVSESSPKHHLTILRLTKADGGGWSGVERGGSRGGESRREETIGKRSKGSI
jgi:hypothetical protein